MDKQYAIYPDNGKLSSLKKELSFDTCYNMDKTAKYAKWKKPNTKGHMHDSIYMKWTE